MKQAIASCICLVLTSCIGGQEIPVEEPRRDDAVVFEFPKLRPVTPGYVARLNEPLHQSRLEVVDETPGVAAVAGMRVKRIGVRGPQGTRKLRVGAVKPLSFRSVAPRSIRDAEFVWSALMSDRAVITFDGAKELGLQTGGEIAIDGHSVEVGAFVEGSAPNIADVLISKQVARRLETRVFVDGPPSRAAAEISTRIDRKPERRVRNFLVVAAEPGTSIKALAVELRQRLPGANLRRIDAMRPSNRAPTRTPAAGQGSDTTIGTMRFRILPNGFIEPDALWVASNITSAAVPVLGSVTCHRIMIPQLAAALGEIQDRGLASRVRTDDYQGCYVPRFIERDPRRGLSMHAFGLALDLNVSTNGFGVAGDMHPDVVRIFEEWGFDWGGRWSPPDPMHFELARIVSS